MSEVRIKYGKDQFGRLIHINDAEHKSFLYTCPECNIPLLVREGDIRIKHFAHSSDDTSNTCSLRSEIHYEQWEKSIRISPVEKDEKDRKLRIIIRKNPYLNKFDLYASLPTTRVEDFLLYNKDERKEIMDSIIVESNCIRDFSIHSDYFLPIEPEVLIPLKQSSEFFKIIIKASQTIPNITGAWESPRISPFDIFIGDEFRAERLTDLSRLSEGEYLYIVVNETSHDIPKECQLYDFDSYKILCSEINEKNIHFLNSILPEKISIDNNSFDVDIVLPPEEKPNSNEPIKGVSGDYTLLSIIPKPDMDPTFEIVSIPFNEENEQIFVDNTGRGNPRYFGIQFPNQGSKRVSIFWSGRHKFFNIYSIKKETAESFLEKQEQSIKIGIQFPSLVNDGVLLPYSNNPEPYLKIQQKDTRYNEIGFKFLGPDDLLIDITGNSSDSKIIDRYYQTSIKKAHSIIKDWFQFNLKYLHLSYGPLGKITIEYQFEKKIEFKPKEIETRLRDLSALPKKANKKTVKLLLELKEDSQIPSGFKKKIRRIMIKIRKEKKTRGKKT